MSVTGRGRGYTGRHHMREPRVGDDPSDRVEHSPRLAEPPKPEPKDNAPKKKDTEDKYAPEMEEKKEKEHKYSATNAEDDAVLKELLYIDEQYTPLLVLLEQFSPGEDGILFNRKLRNFESNVATMCPDEARLQAAFATFRAAALTSSVTARKLAAVGSSFTRQQRQQLLRGALLNVVMQGTFSKLDVLERANPSFLINAANLMGDYFAEARLCNGHKVHILATPLLQYMRALLNSDDIRAHRSLATQLMQNGRELLAVLAQELDDLSISIRLRLLTPPPVSIIWLLLSADLCLNKFLPLPNTLQQFYASHLELTSDENFSEVSYGSWKKEKDEYRSDSSDLAEKVSQNISQISLNQEEDTKPKLRPILGAGAAKLRQEQALSVSQDSFENWSANNKSSLSKRYDLNSWRQEEKKKEEELSQSYPTTNVQEGFPQFNNYQENFVNYLQQGDGTYIQNQYPNNQSQNFTSQGDFVANANQYQSERFDKDFVANANQYQNERFDKSFTQEKETGQFQTAPQIPNERPERVNNEIQKNSRRPVENWRKEKVEKEDGNRNKPKNWTRQRSTDNINEEEEKKDVEKFKTRRDSRPTTRVNRRNSSDDPATSNGGASRTPPRRHVTEVPRNQKYWDHDDRLDKDYNS